MQRMRESGSFADLVGVVLMIGLLSGSLVEAEASGVECRVRRISNTENSVTSQPYPKLP